MPKAKLTAAAMAFHLTLCGPALAWGAAGHRAIATIAAAHLNGWARTRIGDLLGGEAKAQMVRVSTWADTIRRYQRNTATWHYVDIEVGSEGYNAGRDCPEDNCVVAQIQRDEAILSDVKQTKNARVEALMFLIHFVGDVHQPLHAADNHDRGGNETKVAVDGKVRNLHAIWDNEVVRTLSHGSPNFAVQLDSDITPAESKLWASTDPVVWANESFEIARTRIFTPAFLAAERAGPVALPNNYLVSEGWVAKRRLQAAGIRLALILNSVFR